ncbi:hypothetical protein H310_01012 [Aphanomyces invadans]|uniref:Uncharacterized protein n=1 Tax=Aphanomyces invadans TaxID=157072 RepID=A0A024UQK0_9STRA|nr:hypothetical protein H310_01012 [Aphanomyces invadans]ETW08430.1 hypothetical protein H310_01012 [Aphanomyces invadans]|eukprot:XP_008862235.1 hypothetical protein H310_01012 [Aphanomyces invadans]
MAIAPRHYTTNEDPDAASWVKGGDTSRFIHKECAVNPMFKSEYIRNNRSSGHKNVRCFPHCCGSHRESTFCGSSITVQCSDHPVVVYGRFEEAGDNNHTSPHVSIGTVLKLSDIQSDEKTASSPFGMWMVGTSVGNQCYEINKSKLSWHYGWVSSRFNSKTLHRFQVYVFQHVSSQQIKCVSMMASPTFSLCSSRKTRKKAATSAPVTLKLEQPKSEPMIEQTPPDKAKQPPPPQPDSARTIPPPIKIEMPSFESFLRNEPQITRPRTFPGIEQNAPKRLKPTSSTDDLTLRPTLNATGPPSPTPSSTFSFSSFMNPFPHHNAPSSPVPSTTNSCAYSFSSFIRGCNDRPSSPVPSLAPSTFSFSSFLPPKTCAGRTLTCPGSPKTAPGSPVPSSMPSGVVALFSDLIKDDYCRKAKEPKKRVSRYDYIDRAVCLSQIHALASSIISYAWEDGAWDNLAESTTPLHGFIIRTGEWESISIYECRPRTHKTDESYDQVLTFCMNAMRHCIRTGMIARLRAFLHSHASSIFKPELLDQAYADFIVFFEQEIESYVFPRKHMQCAAFLAYLRHNLPLELVSQLDKPSEESADNEPLGYFDLVTQLRQVYQFVKSEEQPVDTLPTFVSRTCVTGRWRRLQPPNQSGASWLFRILGSFMLSHWTLVETPSELLMKFDQSLIPTLTPYLLNGDPMFLSFSPIGMSTGGMQGRAMAGYKAWRNDRDQIVIQWHNWPRGKNGIRRRFSRTLYRSDTDPDVLCSHTVVEETFTSEESLKTFSEMNLSERINFPGEWRVILEEDSTFVRIKD